MSMPNRRSFLGSLGAGAIAGSAASGGLPAPQDAAARPRDVDALVALLRETSRDQLPERVMALGADWRDLLAAAFLAGIRDVEPRPVGFQFHCVMMTAAAFDIAAGAPDAERIAAALYNIDDFKQSQQRDARGGDWTLGPAPAARELEVAAATEAVTRVLEAWDLEGVDAAATDLAHCATLDEAFEPLWWYSMRDFTNIGHKPIYAAQAHRTLQYIGWRHGTDVVRSLVYGLLDGERGAADETFVANRERAAALVLPHGGSPAPAAGMDAALDLVVALRKVSPEEASAIFGDALAGGTSLATAWDALRLFAAEQAWRAPGILSAHAMTSVHALRYIAGRAQRAATRSMALLQAASWQVLYRDFLAARSGYAKDLPGLEAIEAAAEAGAGGSGAAEVFEAAGADARAAAPLALAVARGGTAPLAAATRHWLLRKAHEHHDYKFAAALLEEMEAAAPEVAQRMFAASLGYLRKPSDPDHRLWSLVEGR